MNRRLGCWGAWGYRNRKLSNPCVEWVWNTKKWNEVGWQNDEVFRHFPLCSVFQPTVSYRGGGARSFRYKGIGIGA
eukprot:scaffold25043_cov157-Isochrysis_galbana.AAC.1